MQTVFRRFNLFLSSIQKLKFLSFAFLAFLVFPLVASHIERKDQEPTLKEENIQWLTQQAKLQQLQSEHVHLIRNVAIIGTLMLVLLLRLSYLHYRLKQRSHQLLDSKQDEINQKNHSLEQLLDEKEWMLKEIHHRVRNNLQIVTSLLNSQANQVSDTVALSKIKESQHQVQAIAFIHQRLYQSEQVARVDMEPYLNDLVVYLREAYNLVQPLRFNISVEPITLDVTLAVPLGLIVNEAVTNSLKYAFPGRRPGVISLSLSCVAKATYKLIIADDGIGLTKGYEPSQSHSLGMTLMHGLSKQIDSALTITGHSGVSIQLIFCDEQGGANYNADTTNSWLLHCTALLPVLRLEGLAFEKCINMLK